MNGCRSVIKRSDTFFPKERGREEETFGKIEKVFEKQLTNRQKNGIIYGCENHNEVWLSLVERYVRDVEAAGSNPVTSTKRKSRRNASAFPFGRGDPQENMVCEANAGSHLPPEGRGACSPDAGRANLRRRRISCHLDHMKIIRTFSYLESRSDYLFYLSIPTLIVRDENSLRQGFSLSEATIIR